MAEQNKLVKTVTDSVVLVGLTAGVGFIAKKMLKENFLGDPSSSIMSYAKFTGVLAGSMALKTYLEDQKSFQGRRSGIEDSKIYISLKIWQLWQCCWAVRFLVQ